MQQLMLKTSQWALALVFLVILAGSVVRMTGSGMGCPDWPKCFGHYIPPTNQGQIEWKESTFFKKGQMILWNENLLVAKESHTTTKEFNSDLWSHYDKHDYSIFNPIHTWIEYINRLLGALSGIPVLLLFVLSIIGAKKRPGIFFLSFFSVLALGFVAWLGKVVVDGNLIPHSITYHMFGALAVVIPLLAILFILRTDSKLNEKVSVKFKWLMLLALILSLVQVYLGTAVREQIDAMSQTIGRNDFIDNLDITFFIHRSFSILLLLVNGLLIYLAFNADWKNPLLKLLGALLLVEILAGVLLNYAGFPAAAQPIHLLCAMGIVAVQFYLTMQVWFSNVRASFATR
jgi:cytochrome c oxidase assembly protein subunit 15